MLGSYNHPFDQSRKNLFIQYLLDHPRNIGKVCKLVGVDRETYNKHFQLDKAFARAVTEALEDDLDDIESNFVKLGKTKSGFLPGMSVLRAFRGETWNPEHRMTVVHQVSDDEGAKTLSSLRDVVDADIIGPTETLPQIETKASERP